MSRRLLIMAAGTGGHIFPGLAIARTMQERGWQVSWLGTRHGMEQNIVPANGIEMDSIDFAGMRGKGLAHMLSGGMKMVAGLASCWSILGRRKPDVVLGMGGYVTVPGGMAARMRSVPLVVVNADARLLLSNQALAPHAKRVLFGFEADFGAATGKAEVTGNPVRSEIIALPSPEQRFAGRSGPLKLLVVGGSLGAKVLNDTVPAALAQMPPDARPQVVHQTGRQHIDAVRAAYAQSGIEAEVIDFINDMPRRYAEADLVLCRAGAITVSELTAAGVASVLVPFVVSSTSHQRDNARMMAERQAAIHLPQEELDSDVLASLIREMTREKCLELARAAYALGRRDANDRIADVLAAVAAGAK